RLHCSTQFGAAAVPVCHMRSMPVAETVTPYTAWPFVRYMALLPSDAPLLSIGVPRELKRTHDVLAIAAPVSSRQAVDWPIAAWLLGGGVATAPKPKLEFVDRYVVPPSTVQCVG